MSPSLKNKDSFNMIVKTINEGPNYHWENEIERQLWKEVANDFLTNHLNGRKTLISEACFHAYSIKTNNLLIESTVRLNEGFFDKIKDALGGALAKMAGKLSPAVKSRNWWIFGGGGEKETKKYLEAYLEALQNQKEITTKLASKSIPALIKEIKRFWRDFPNGNSENDFEYAISQFVIFYESIRHSAGAKNSDGELPPTDASRSLGLDEANKLIKDLRKVMQYLDRDLDDKYTYVENRIYKVPTLAETLLLEADDDDIGAEGRKTSGMKGLESDTATNVLSSAGRILSLLGALGGAFGWLSGQSWFKKMFEDPVKASSFLKMVGKKTGVTNHLAALLGDPGRDLSGMKVSDFMKEMAAKGLVNGEKPSEKLLQLAKQAGNNDFASWWSTNLEGQKHATQTLAKAIPLSGAGAPDAGGDIFSDKILTPIRTKLAAAGSGVGTTAGIKFATIGAWSSLVGTLGVGLLTSAAAIKLLRDAGAKKSRASKIQAAINLFKDIKPDEIPPETPLVRPDAPTELSGKMNVKADGDKTLVTIGNGVTSPEGFVMPYISFELVPSGDKDKFKEVALFYLESQIRANTISYNAEKSFDDVKRLDIVLDDSRPLGAAPSGSSTSTSASSGSGDSSGGGGTSASDATASGGTLSRTSGGTLSRTSGGTLSRAPDRSGGSASERSRGRRDSSDRRGSTTTTYIRKLKNNFFRKEGNKYFFIKDADANDQFLALRETLMSVAATRPIKREGVKRVVSAIIKLHKKLDDFGNNNGDHDIGGNDYKRYVKKIFFKKDDDGELEFKINNIRDFVNVLGNITDFIKNHKDRNEEITTEDRKKFIRKIKKIHNFMNHFEDLLEESLKKSKDNLILERWQTLAGIIK